MSGIPIKSVSPVEIPVTLYRLSPIVPDRGTLEKGEK